MARTYLSVAKRMMKDINFFLYLLAAKIKENASWSTQIPDTVQVIESKYNSSSRSINAGITVGDEFTPHARVFEYGSGIHRKKKKKSKYPIVPINARVLSFPRSRWPKYEPPPDKDVFFFKRVLHPGVKARPYVRPAVEEMGPRFNEYLGDAFVRASGDFINVRASFSVRIDLG